MKAEDYLKEVLPSIRSIVLQRKTSFMHLLSEELKKAIPVRYEETLDSILKEEDTPYEGKTILVDLDALPNDKYFEAISSFKVRGIGVVGCENSRHCINKLVKRGYVPEAHVLELYIGDEGIYEVCYEAETQEVTLTHVFDENLKFMGHSLFVSIKN